MERKRAPHGVVTNKPIGLRLLPQELTDFKALCEDVAERIEHDIREALPYTHVTTHVEPLEDPASMSDQELDRAPTAGSPALPPADAH